MALELLELQPPMCLVPSCHTEKLIWQALKGKIGGLFLGENCGRRKRTALFYLTDLISYHHHKWIITAKLSSSWHFIVALHIFLILKTI